MQKIGPGVRASLEELSSLGNHTFLQKLKIRPSQGIYAHGMGIEPLQAGEELAFLEQMRRHMATMNAIFRLHSGLLRGL